MSVTRLAALFLLASAALFAGCSPSRQKGHHPPVVNTAQISTETFTPSIESISLLESTSAVSLRPETDGRVVKILVRDGASVKAGQPILVLDNVQQTAAVNAANTEAHKDRLNAERYAYLHSQGAVSAKRRDYFAAQAIESRDRAIAKQATLEYKTVRSPIDGIIGSLDRVKIGDFVKTGELITGLVGNESLWTLMQVPAAQADAVKLGQAVTVKTHTNPPVSERGSVTFISPYYGISGSSQAANTLLVKASLPNHGGRLKTGQYVTSRITVSQETSLAVPVQAVFMQAQQPFVYVLLPVKQAISALAGSSVKRPARLKVLEKLPESTPVVVQRAVKLGPLQGNFYPLLSGLTPGETVVVSNTALLRNGLPVKVAS